MFFYLSKILLFFIKPFSIILLMLVLSFFVTNRRWQLYLRIGVISLVLFFSTGLIFNEVLLRWEVPAIPIMEITGTYEVGIVLGGTADTERPPFDRLYFSKGAERITQAVTLYKAGKIRKILFTGGNAELFEDPEKDNAPIYQYYLSCGVDPDDIIIENRSRNTHENAVLTKEMLVKNNLLDKKHLLLTSAFHMRRAMACYEKEGIEVLGFSTDFYTALLDDRYDFNQFLPSAPVLGNWEFLLKEFIGYIAYWFAGYI